MKEYLSNIYTDNREWIKFTIKWFGFAMIVGAVTYFIKPELIYDIIELFQDKFGDQPAQDVNLASEIFFQNSTACAIALLGGVLFGVSSFLTVFFNGFIIGFVVLTLFNLPGSTGDNIVYLILGLVPHGIFELPAILLAAAVGTRLGTEWLKGESKGMRWRVFRNNVGRTINIIPLLAFLLLIAAFVEVFVSGQFVNNL